MQIIKVSSFILSLLAEVVDEKYISTLWNVYYWTSLLVEGED